jgi:Flp pilus assembly protein TadG
MDNGRNKTSIQYGYGQSMVEFALILPLMVLVIVGIFDLGRAFFSYIAITNAAREGARVYTFWPDKAKIADIVQAVDVEIGSSSVVSVSKIASIEVYCGDLYTRVHNDTDLKACPSEKPIRVTVTYNFDLILGFILPKQLTLVRSADMRVP